MKKVLTNFKNNSLRRFIRKYERSIPIIFFIGGFIFDTLTLGRIDRLYDLTVLCIHMTLLTITIYLFNLVGDGKWKNTFFERYIVYFPLAIQFFFGGLSSAYVVYFSRSVSFSKTAFFFVIILLLFFANEFLKKRISNKYLQFGVYFFINFIFFAFMIPVFMKKMGFNIFIFSGLVSLTCTLLLITIIYTVSKSTRREVKKRKLLGLIFSIYLTINLFFYFKLIPPIPLALKNGMVAHNIKFEDHKYLVTYETGEWYAFWRTNRLKFIHKPGDSVYVFSSIFAPTHLKKTIFHRWKWYNEYINEWEIIEDIGYEITGGRDGGFRGYTYKKNVKKGRWKVEVITDEELVIGVIDFELIVNSNLKPKGVVEKIF
jgi:hypothetical protein